MSGRREFVCVEGIKEGDQLLGFEPVKLGRGGCRDVNEVYI